MKMGIQVAQSRKTSFYAYEFPNSSNQMIVTNIPANTVHHSEHQMDSIFSNLPEKSGGENEWAVQMAKLLQGVQFCWYTPNEPILMQMEVLQIWKISKLPGYFPFEVIEAQVTVSILVNNPIRYSSHR